MDKKFFVALIITALLMVGIGVGVRASVVLPARVLALASNLTLDDFRLGDLKLYIEHFFKSGSTTPPTNLPNIPTPKPFEPLNSYEEAIVAAVDKASPAVVSIVISKDVPIIEQCGYSPFGDLPPEFQQFFGGGAPFQFYRPCQKGSQRQQVGGGSGFIVGSDGWVVTNKHVVADTDASYTVFTNDGKKYEAKVLARNPVQDVAILKIDASKLPVVQLGDSSGIRLGQTAIAIGNALGEFRNTVSVGIVSGLSRTVNAAAPAGTVEHIEGVIQTDAAINPGNSGGPLLNSRGEVIGINTAIVSGAQNIGFAIPINRVKRDIESVKRGGKISVPYLGVRYTLITPEIAKRDYLPIEVGALIRGSDDGPAVMLNSPAAIAGIQAEDIIVEINNIKIDSDHSLASLLQQYAVGEEVRLKLLRNGKSLVVSVKLKERDF